MLKRTKLSCAVIGVIATGGFNALALAEGAKLEEIVVTATKSSASIQDIPLAVEALTEKALDDLNIGNFGDYMMALPKLSVGGRGPGQNNMYIRGVATDVPAVGTAGMAGVQPSVGLYLDEAPVTAAARNLDIYVTDMNRIEVLSGPQGTLFGASSQSGTVRLITNKPDLNEFSGGADFGVSQTHNGDMSSNGEGYINIPIIEGKLAARAVVYSVNHGGYIDNVPGEFSLPESNPSFREGMDLHVDRNSELVEEDFNTSSYKGARLGLKYQINDDWSLLVQGMQQEISADGVFDYAPEVGDLQVKRFYKDSVRDDVSQTSWTLEGRYNALDIIYTGSYLDREIEQSFDQSGYANFGPYIPYYVCNYPAYTSCNSSIVGFDAEEEFERTSHELRISTNPDSTLHFVGGVYYDEAEFVNRANFIIPGIVGNGFTQQIPIVTASNSDPNPRDPGVAFVNDITRDDEQIAVFGELTYQLNDYFSATLGLRYYDLDYEQVGSSNFNFRGETDAQAGRNLDELLSPASESDTVPKVTVKWTPNEDTLLYATYSEGFRPGGFNRKPGGGVPESFVSDTVENYELGWKSMLLDGALQFNGAVYRIDWADMQLNSLDPSISNLNFTRNVGEAEITGVEGDFVYAATENLTLSGGFSINNTELTSVPEGATNIVGAGADLSMTPTFQGNLLGRYTYDVGRYQGFTQLSVTYKGSAFSSIVLQDRFEMESYTLANFSIGVNADQWTGELYVNNITDKRPELYISFMDDTNRTLTNRPRTIGMRFSYDF